MTSHQALAEKIPVSWQTVQLWEKEGGTAPSRKRMARVAEVLETTPEYLLYGNDGHQQAHSDPETPKASKHQVMMLAELVEIFLSSGEREQEEILDAARTFRPKAKRGVAENQR